VYRLSSSLCTCLHSLVYELTVVNLFRKRHPTLKF
jgi:hypothetical protein